jgi:hypothetical protein
MTINYVSFHQCAVVNFLVTENNSAANIFDQLCHVYGDSHRDASNVQHWVKHFTDGKMDITDLPHSGQLRNAIMESNKQKVDILMTED